MASSRAFFSYRRSLRALRNPNLEKLVVCYHTSGRLVEESLEGFFSQGTFFVENKFMDFLSSTGGRNLRRKMLLVGDKTEVAKAIACCFLP
ncbi:predicted protein [Arabidopsis lyrata subsp. lyrata]|uniref:Predicted protein n=1 Tax=Arabidopsis lyrata subsp. lyrata TaxID=81972 RepID=D7KFX4_ARALL|nr:predicted protein [Arabidopsis lyrata subsp. lyrata]